MQSMNSTYAVLLYKDWSLGIYIHDLLRISLFHFFPHPLKKNPAFSDHIANSHSSRYLVMVDIFIPLGVKG